MAETAAAVFSVLRAAEGHELAEPPGLHELFVSCLRALQAEASLLPPLEAAALASLIEDHTAAAAAPDAALC